MGSVDLPGYAELKRALPLRMWCHVQRCRARVGQLVKRELQAGARVGARSSGGRACTAAATATGGGGGQQVVLEQQPRVAGHVGVVEQRERLGVAAQRREWWCVRGAYGGGGGM